MTDIRVARDTNAAEDVDGNGAESGGISACATLRNCIVWAIDAGEVASRAVLKSRAITVVAQQHSSARRSRAISCADSSAKACEDFARTDEATRRQTV